MAYNWICILTGLVVCAAGEHSARMVLEFRPTRAAAQLDSQVLYGNFSSIGVIYPFQGNVVLVGDVCGLFAWQRAHMSMVSTSFSCNSVPCLTGLVTMPKRTLCSLGGLRASTSPHQSAQIFLGFKTRTLRHPNSTGHLSGACSQYTSAARSRCVVHASAQSVYRQLI
jgi:hypothetical protein